MKGIPYYDLDYCMYSDWGYKKRTRIWTNKKDWENKLCDGSGACGNMVNTKKHKLNVSKDVHTVGEKKDKYKHSADVSKDVGGGTNRLDRYRVPEDLIFSLFMD